jgi:uncharacterized protein YfaS (alpha-2-macroglobulin family)
VINNKFKTESSATDVGNNWNWSYVEYKPDVVMANSSYVWQKEVAFEYYFRAEFEGSYTKPPVVGYLMYEPEVRSSGGYGEVVVEGR